MIVGIATEYRLWQSIAARMASWNRGVTMSVAGIILDKSYRTQLSVTPLHCVADVPLAPEKCQFFSFKEYLRGCGRMLKTVGLLTRPTPARQDAPFRRQGRSELPLL